MFSDAKRATNLAAVETLLTVELAKLGVPLGADINDVSLFLGIIVGRILQRGATREQVLAFLSNVLDESSKIEEEVILPGCELREQLRFSRMLSAQVWEMFYAIEDASPTTPEDAPDADERAHQKWDAAAAATTFVVEFQMLVSRSR